ncbi:MAG: glycosyltransferase [Spiribacter salinus]|uniref:Glycosyltransferase n=1 Tax=Spiribacter salinus TaxID=1335746 RepID=A0A540VRM8_9GAMM|nr:MAG: glycosyltransferase [Spiribacter salinus]
MTSPRGFKPKAAGISVWARGQYHACRAAVSLSCHGRADGLPCMDRHLGATRRMEIFVFSYNRGRYLRNCLESIVRHAPGTAVTIYDDASDDPEVLRVLDDYRQHCRIESNDNPQRGHYVGGLYANMNRALAEANTDVALFIQEDMQLTRDITDTDIDYLHRFFDTYPDAVELHTGFLKGRQRTKKKEAIEIDRAVPVYFRSPTGKGSIYFSAVGVLNVGRLNRDGYTFSAYEADNDRRIGERYHRMGISPYPWMMWLPFSEASKFRSKGLMQRYAEWRTGAGFYPYRSMNAEETRALFDRDVAELPYAEDWLDPVGMNMTPPWNFSDAAKFVPLTRKLLKFRKRLRQRSRRATPDKAPP